MAGTLSQRATSQLIRGVLSHGHESSLRLCCGSLWSLNPGSVASGSSHSVKRQRGLSTMTSEKHSYARRLIGSEKNVWVEFTKLAGQPGVLNLGQGFPDFEAPDHVVDSLQKATSSNKLLHQYTRPYGHPRLVNALAQVYAPGLQRDIDPMTEVLVSVGAYGALFSVIHGMVNPGDEVVIIEPYFDCYEPMVRTASGTPVFVPLRPSKTGVMTTSADWKLDPVELESKFNDKTKLIVLNTPNNPLGKVYSREELELVAHLCQKYDVVCVADEVYEWMTYPGKEHIKIATLPGMWDRTVTVGSAGKTFSVTGWKLGWTVASEKLLQGPKIVHQNCVYNCPTPIQEGLEIKVVQRDESPRVLEIGLFNKEAVAQGLEIELARRGEKDCYFQSLALELLPKREALASVLESLGLHPVVPEGGYFMLADISQMKVDLSEFTSDEPRDFKFIKWMIKEKKLAGIPPSAFYCQEHKGMGENFIRFCFIKEDSTLKKAEEILRQWKKDMN